MAKKMTTNFGGEEPDQTFTEKFSRKAEESPFVIAGLVGLVGSCAYAAYRYKTRGPSMSPSIFLMQLRVYAQGLFLGMAALGVGVKAYQDIRKKSKQKEEQKSLET